MRYCSSTSAHAQEFVSSLLKMLSRECPCFALQKNIIIEYAKVNYMKWIFEF